MNDTTTVTEVADILAENYLGIGSTPDTALAALEEDIRENRLHADDYGVTREVLVLAIATLYARIRDTAGAW